MTAPLKAADGTAALPAYAFGSTAGLGLFKSTNGLGIAVGGVQVAELGANGFSAGLPLGTPLFVPDGVLPPFCVWADGRNISRTSYAALFTKWGTKYGVGDGSTTFGVMDMRGRGFIGRDNFGGTDASRLASVPAVSGDRLTVGSIIGENRHALTSGENGAHSHNVSVYGVLNDIYPTFQSLTLSTAAPQYNATVATSSSTTPNGVSSTGTSDPSGSGTAHNNVQQSLVCDVAIFAGA